MGGQMQNVISSEIIWNEGRQRVSLHSQIDVAVSPREMLHLAHGSGQGMARGRGCCGDSENALTRNPGGTRSEIPQNRGRWDPQPHRQILTHGSHRDQGHQIQRPVGRVDDPVATSELRDLTQQLLTQAPASRRHNLPGAA